MRRNPPAKWVLPLVVSPSTSTDWCVPVPDDPFHRAAFLGALASLGSAYKWQDDPDHTAKEVAQVWRDIADNLERCMTQPQTIIIDEWEDDQLAICESLRWNDGVLEGLCCGEWTPIKVLGGGPPPGPGGQPQGTPRPGPGLSKCFNVLLDANNRWQLPFSVLPGDTVTITNITGTWSDGTLSPWYCPDGETAIFGLCTGGGQGHDGGDPDATLFHMQLAAIIGTAYESGTDGPITVAGSGPQQLTLQANDGTLSDNSGSLNLKICVENGGAPPSEVWCYAMDLLAAPYLWEDLGSGATWTSGTGWHIGTGSLAIVLPLGGFYDLSEVIAVMSTNSPDIGAPNQNYAISSPVGTAWCNERTDAHTPGFTLTCDDPVLNTNNVEIQFSGQAGSQVAITQVILYGTGTNPFGASNC